MALSVMNSFASTNINKINKVVAINYNLMWYKCKNTDVSGTQLADYADPSNVIFNGIISNTTFVTTNMASYPFASYTHSANITQTNSYFQTKSLTIGNLGVTISFWTLKTTWINANTNFSFTATHYTNGNSEIWIMSHSNGTGANLQFGFNTNGASSNNLPSVVIILPSTTWLHVCWSVYPNGSSNGGFYINGVAQTLGGSPSVLNCVPGNVYPYVFLANQYGGNRVATGQYTNLRIINKALTPTEVTKLYNTDSYT